MIAWQEGIEMNTNGIKKSTMEIMVKLCAVESTQKIQKLNAILSRLKRRTWWIKKGSVDKMDQDKIAKKIWLDSPK